jgi:hypothetical protein
MDLSEKKFHPSWASTELLGPLICTIIIWFCISFTLYYLETVESFTSIIIIASCASCVTLCGLTRKNTEKERDIKVRTLFRRTSETYSRLKKALKRTPNNKKKDGGSSSSGSSGSSSGGGCGSSSGSGSGSGGGATGFAAPEDQLPGLVIEAVRRGDAKTIERWIGINNVDSRESESGSTLLHFAALEDQSRVARLLLKASANPNITDTEGNSPLHIAAAQGSAIIVKYLCEYGANPYELNEKKDGTRRMSPMDLAEQFDNRGCVLIMERAVRMQNKPGGDGISTPRMRNTVSPSSSSV